MKKLSYVFYLVLVAVFAIGCTHNEQKKIKIYYVNGTQEVLNVSHRVHSDDSYGSLILDNGCVYMQYSSITLRCGVIRYAYCN